MMNSEYVWHVDGHQVLLTVNMADVVASPGVCPFGQSEGADCYHAGIDGCVVNYFVKHYGLDTNAGSVPATPILEVAWASAGDKWDIELVEFHMIPIADPQFAEWYVAVKLD